MRRIAVFSYQSGSDPEAQLYMTAFIAAMRERGWSVGHNLQIDYRWTESDTRRIARFASEVVRCLRKWSSSPAAHMSAPCRR